MGDMDKRTGPHDGPDDHPAGAGGSGMGPVEVPADRDAGPGGTGSAAGFAADRTSAHSEPLVDPDEDPRLAAFLERTTEVLQSRPIEFTARRHLAAMRAAASETAIRRRHPVMWFAGVAAAAAVAVVTLAGFGALPAPAQHVMSEVAERLGFTIPSPDTDPGVPAESPSKQRPAPETVPGLPGGPDRSELPGLREDGVLQTPGQSDGMTPPGQDADRTVPGQQDRGTTPGQDEGVVPPGQSEDATPPGQPDPPDRSGADGAPGAPGGTPGTDPPGEPSDPPGQSTDPPDQPEMPPPPPAHGQGSDVPEEEPSAPGEPPDEGNSSETSPPSEKGKKPRP